MVVVTHLKRELFSPEWTCMTGFGIVNMALLFAEGEAELDDGAGCHL